MKHLCPVCGYPELRHPPSDYTICPSCGTEFGNDDLDATHSELRVRWLTAGAPWFSEYTPPPANWNPYRQLVGAGLDYSLGEQHTPKPPIELRQERVVTSYRLARRSNATRSQLWFSFS